MLLHQCQFLLAGELFNLRLANTGAAAIITGFHQHYFFRAAPAKVLGSGSTALVLGKTPLYIRGNTCVE